MMMDGRQLPAWYFDEFRLSPWDTREEAEAYARNSFHSIEEDRELMHRLGLTAGDALIDLGCGAGTMALAAAGICQRVIAVDISEAMLGVAQQQAASMGLDAIEFVHAGFLTYEHAGEPVDFAVTRHVLHHLPDLWKVEALRRVAAIMKPGGTFYLQELVYSFEPDEMESAVRAWVERVPEEPDGNGFRRSFFEEHTRDRFSSYAWTFEEMLRRTGFEITDTWYQDGMYARYTCVRR